MDHFASGQHQQMVDVASDSDDDDDIGSPVDNNFRQGNGPANAIDLTGLDDIPDVDVPPSSPPPAQSVSPAEITEALSEASCLQMVLNVLPDVAVDHVLALLQERAHHSRTLVDCERLITRILDDSAYPKEHDEVNKRKRKREDSDDDMIKYESGEQDSNATGYQKNALQLLQDEFLLLPVRHIENTLQEHKTLFKSYGILEGQLRNYHAITSSLFSKLNRSRNKKGIEWKLIAAGNTLPKELKAAKTRSKMESEQRRKEKEAERVEEENLNRAQAQGELEECQCCFGEVPRNRMTWCNGEKIHLFCLLCAKTYVEGEMGNAKCWPVCFADTSCGGTFTRHQLLEFLGKKSFDCLEHLQQQSDIAAAGLDFLDECPFCDFKAECPPVEVDREFRCLNPKCKKTSCRLCQKETHIPLSCEEAKKDSTLTFRHVVEEAMSSALIRHCNRCKHPFVKEQGCNKMTCSHCQNIQCYVCSKNVTNYDHFGGGPNRCPLHDNLEARHEEEVKKAADDALATVRAEHPDISEAELMIQVSDRVKQAEKTRKGQADAANIGFPFHMVGNQLVQGPAGHERRIDAGLAHHAGPRPARAAIHPQFPPIIRRRDPPRPVRAAAPPPPAFVQQPGLAQFYNPFGAPPVQFFADAPAQAPQLQPNNGPQKTSHARLPFRAQAAAQPLNLRQQQQQQNLNVRLEEHRQRLQGQRQRWPEQHQQLLNEQMVQLQQHLHQHQLAQQQRQTDRQQQRQQLIQQLDQRVQRNGDGYMLQHEETEQELTQQLDLLLEHRRRGVGG